MDKVLISKEIIKIHYNWRMVSNGIESGEDYDVAEVGQLFDIYDETSTVTKILEHKPINSNDKLYYDIYLENDQMIRIFNPNVIFF